MNMHIFMNTFGNRSSDCHWKSTTNSDGSNSVRKTELGRRPKDSKYSPRPSLTCMQIQCQPGVCEGSVLQTKRRGMEGRVSTLNTPSKFVNWYLVA